MSMPGHERTVGVHRTQLTGQLIGDVSRQLVGLGPDHGKPGRQASTARRTRAVLPDPASPSTHTTPGWRAMAASAQAEMRAISWARPTKSSALAPRSDKATAPR